MIIRMHAHRCLTAQAMKPVDVPIYDFVHHCRSEKRRRVEPADVVIVEGILVLHMPEIRDLLNMKIYVDTDDDVRLARRCGCQYQGQRRVCIESVPATDKDTHTQGERGGDSGLCVSTGKRNIHFSLFSLCLSLCVCEMFVRHRMWLCIALRVEQHLARRMERLLSTCEGLHTTVRKAFNWRELPCCRPGLFRKADAANGMHSH